MRVHLSGGHGAGGSSDRFEYCNIRMCWYRVRLTCTSGTKPRMHTDFFSASLVPSVSNTYMRTLHYACPSPIIWVSTDEKGYSARSYNVWRQDTDNERNKNKEQIEPWSSLVKNEGIKCVSLLQEWKMTIRQPFRCPFHHFSWLYETFLVFLIDQNDGSWLSLRTLEDIVWGLTLVSSALE